MATRKSSKKAQNENINEQQNSQEERIDTMANEQQYAEDAFVTFAKYLGDEDYDSCAPAHTPASAKEQKATTNQPAPRTQQRGTSKFAMPADYEKLSLQALAEIVVKNPNDQKAKREIRDKVSQKHAAANIVRLKKKQFAYLEKISTEWLGLRESIVKILDDPAIIQSKLVSHGVFQNPWTEAFSTMDIIEMSTGIPNPEGGVYIRGLDAISQLFPEHYATVVAGPVSHILTVENREIPISAVSLNRLIGTAITETKQVAPFTTQCVLWRDTSLSTTSSHTYDGITMVIPAGTAVTGKDRKTYTFEKPTRLSMPRDVYSWNVEPAETAKGVERPLATANQLKRLDRMVQANQHLKTKNGQMHRPESSFELEWLKCIDRYYLVGEKCFEPGKMCAYMDKEILFSFADFCEAWARREEEREQRRQERREARQTESTPTYESSKISANNKVIDPFTDLGDEL